jgi:preprotein translocase subunit YajC
MSPARAWTPGDQITHRDGTWGTIISVYPGGSIAVDWDDDTTTELEAREQELDLHPSTLEAEAERAGR